MRSDVQRHYDDLLAAHYAWMSGMTFADKVAEQRGVLASLGFPAEARGLAVDLGCGPGYQSVALRALGYQNVIALDTSAALLDELTAACDDKAIQPHVADMRDFARFVGEGAADAIVCMGDTITHLESGRDVSALFADAYQALRPGGRLAPTFRDFSVALQGTDRFIPVRADDARIMTCALYYEQDHVVVSDLLHLRTDAGWQFHKSSYRKLRLAPAAIAAELRQIGFTVEHEMPVARMQAVVARKG